MLSVLNGLVEWFLVDLGDQSLGPSDSSRRHGQDGLDLFIDPPVQSREVRSDTVNKADSKSVAAEKRSPVSMYSRARPAPIPGTIYGEMTAR